MLCALRTYACIINILLLSLSLSLSHTHTHITFLLLLIRHTLLDNLLFTLFRCQNPSMFKAYTHMYKYYMTYIFKYKYYYVMICIYIYCIVYT